MVPLIPNHGSPAEGLSTLCLLATHHGHYNDSGKSPSNSNDSLQQMATQKKGGGMMANAYSNGDGLQ